MLADQIKEDVLDKHTEHTNPMSTIVLWQKQAARKSTLSCVGTTSRRLIEGGERKVICGIRRLIGNKQILSFFFLLANAEARRLVDRDRYKHRQSNARPCCRKTASGP